MYAANLLQVSIQTPLHTYIHMYIPSTVTYKMLMANFAKNNKLA